MAHMTYTAHRSPVCVPGSVWRYFAVGPLDAATGCRRANAAGPPADVSSWDLPLELYERWEERVCILHFDGKVPWKQAESLALADVLHQAARTQEAATEFN